MTFLVTSSDILVVWELKLENRISVALQNSMAVFELILPVHNQNKTLTKHTYNIREINTSSGIEEYN